VRSVKFVGSTAGGKKVAEIAGRAMKRAAYELGGSDPCIVLEDADLDLATTKGMIGRLHTNGQACNNHKRFIVHEKVYEEFVDTLIRKIKGYVKIGDPMEATTTIGPLSMAKQVENLT
jgi:succinate-semialdehyde dehydrogenase/glutarate-semialdehyde dehydrogenase